MTDSIIPLTPQTKIETVFGFEKGKLTEAFKKTFRDHKLKPNQMFAHVKLGKYAILMTIEYPPLQQTIVSDTTVYLQGGVSFENKDNIRLGFYSHIKGDRETIMGNIDDKLKAQTGEG